MRSARTLSGRKRDRIRPPLAAIALLFAMTGHCAADEPNWGRGPFEQRDMHPLAALRGVFYPLSTRPAGPGMNEVSFSGSWTNTLNRHAPGADREGSYLVDAESREAVLSLRHGIGEQLTVAGSVPFHYRGSGVADDAIDGWHRFWGLPRGQRDKVPDDSYDISGTRGDQTPGDGTGFDVTEEGVGVGAPELDSRYLLTEGDGTLPALSLVGALSGPSPQLDYGHAGIDATIGAAASKRVFGDFVLYAGAGYTYLTAPDSAGVPFRRSRFAGFAGIEWQPTALISLYAGLYPGSGALDFPEWPSFQLYLDTGMKIALTPAMTAELFVREDPGPGTGTADISLAGALTFRSRTANPSAP